MENKSIRIKDIARLAGVSVGTVDRVLHQRGKVSGKSYQKVQAVLQQIDYKPNLIARSLGLNKTFRVAAILPDPKLDPFWAQSYGGIQQSREEWQQQGLVINPHFYDLHNSESFKDVFQKAIGSKPDGVVVAPLFYKEALPFFHELHGLGIPYILFNTLIEEPAPLSFIGQDLYQSGRLAAELLSLGVGSGGTVAILHVHEDLPNSVHLMEKERGFREYLSSSTDKKFTTVTLHLAAPDKPSFRSDLLSLLGNENLKGIFISTSKTYEVVEVMKETGKKGIRIVGYDLLEENLSYLKHGYIHFLINQNPSKQASSAVRSLVEYLVFKTTPSAKTLLPLEIITKENTDTYTIV